MLNGDGNRLQNRLVLHSVYRLSFFKEEKGHAGPGVLHKSKQSVYTLPEIPTWLSPHGQVKEAINPSFRPRGGIAGLTKCVSAIGYVQMTSSAACILTLLAIVEVDNGSLQLQDILIPRSSELPMEPAKWVGGNPGSRG